MRSWWRIRRARARRLLQEEASQLIANIAGEIVSRQLTPQDQTHFVQSFLTETRTADAAAIGGKLSGVDP
jgi:F0F1-type ATP synthase membrane subunit b/b'